MVHHFNCSSRKSKDLCFTCSFHCQCLGSWNILKLPPMAQQTSACFQHAEIVWRPVALRAVSASARLLKRATPRQQDKPRFGRRRTFGFPKFIQKIIFISPVFGNLTWPCSPTICHSRQHYKTNHLLHVYSFKQFHVYNDFYYPKFWDINSQQTSIMTIPYAIQTRLRDRNRHLFFKSWRLRVAEPQPMHCFGMFWVFFHKPSWGNPTTCWQKILKYFTYLYFLWSPPCHKHPENQKNWYLFWHIWHLIPAKLRTVVLAYILTDVNTNPGDSCLHWGHRGGSVSYLSHVQPRCPRRRSGSFCNEVL